MPVYWCSLTIMKWSDLIVENWNTSVAEYWGFTWIDGDNVESSTGCVCVCVVLCHRCFVCKTSFFIWDVCVRVYVDEHHINVSYDQSIRMVIRFFERIKCRFTGNSFVVDWLSFTHWTDYLLHMNMTIHSCRIIARWRPSPFRWQRTGTVPFQQKTSRSYSIWHVYVYALYSFTSFIHSTAVQLFLTSICWFIRYPKCCRLHHSLSALETRATITPYC